MSQHIVKAISDLHSKLSFGGKGGYSDRNKTGRGGISDRYKTGRGGYSDGGNWHTAIDLNQNNSVYDEAGFAISAVTGVGGGAVRLGLGLFGMYSYNR
jgi:hypothetical protein